MLDLWLGWGFYMNGLEKNFLCWPVHISPDESVIRLKEPHLTKLEKKSVVEKKPASPDICLFTSSGTQNLFKDDITSIASRNLIKKFPTHRN